MKVLVCLDYGKEKEKIWKTLIERPWPEKSHFYLFHCVQLPYPGIQEGIFIPPNIFGELSQELKEKAQNLLKESVDYLTQANFPYPVETIIKEGVAKREIVQFAKENQIDLILIGSHGYSAIERFLLGSVSLYVASHAPCSVEIIRA